MQNHLLSEKLKSGVCISDDCTSDNPRKPLLKEKQKLSCEEPKAFGSYWKKPSPSVKAISDEILIQPLITDKQTQEYYNRNSEWVWPLGRQIQTYSGQNSNFCENYEPQNSNTHILNSKDLRNMQSWEQKSNATHTMSADCIQKRMPIDCTNSGFIVLHKPNLGYEHIGAYKSTLELSSQPTMNVTAEVLHKKTSQFCVPRSEDNSGCEVVAEKVVLDNQMVKPVNTCTKNALDISIEHFSKQFGKSRITASATSTQALRKETFQQPYVPLKAVAVVTPLAQQGNACVTFSKKSTKANEESFGTRFVPVKEYHRQYMSRPLQSPTNEGAKGSNSLCGNAVQTHCMPQEMPIESVFNQGFSKQDPVEVNTFSNQSESLHPVTVISTNLERMPSNMEDHCSAVFQHNTATVNESYNGKKTTMDIEVTDCSSPAQINEWSLQKLSTLVTDSEQRQKESEEEMPFTDLSSEILKLYWNGDYKKLCEAARSNNYVNIMKEVKLYCAKKHSVILQEMSKERPDHVSDDFDILKHDLSPLTGECNSTLLNPDETVCNANKGHGISSYNSAFHSEPKVVDGEVDGQQIMQVAKNTNTKASKEASNGTGHLLPTVQKIYSASILRNGVLMNEPMNMDSENKKQRAKEPLLKSSTVTSNTCNVTNVTVNTTEAEELPKTQSKNEDASLENEVPQIVLMKKSQVMSYNYMHEKPKDLLKLPATGGSSSLNICNTTDHTDPFKTIKINILSPNKTKKYLARETNADVQNTQKQLSVQTYTDSCEQIIVKPYDQVPKGEEHMKSAEKKNRIHDPGQVEKYCCIAKWFQVLGYANYLLCTCDKKAEQSLENEASGQKLESPAVADSIDDVEIVEVISDCQDVSKIFNTISEDILTADCGLNSLTKKKRSRSEAEGKQRTPQTTFGSFASKAEILSNDTSQMALNSPSTNNTNRFLERGEETTTADLWKKEKIVNLTLYGSSGKNHCRTITSSCAKKRFFGFRSSEKNFPPATINIRMTPCLNDYPNINETLTAKQRILKSWRNSHVPTEIFTGRRKSENKKRAKITESQTDSVGSSAFGEIRCFLSHQQDKQTCGSELAKNEVTFSTDQHKNLAERSKKKIQADPARRKNIKKKHKKRTASLSHTRIQNINKSKSTNPSCELLQTSSKHEHRRDLALDFKVLPESFSFTDGSNGMEIDQSTTLGCEIPSHTIKTDNQKKKTLRPQGAWCVSPKKKGYPRSGLSSDVSVLPSTFQDFKRRYEEKKKTLLPDAT